MVAREAPECPDWLVPGAAVLVYTVGGASRATDSVATTVAKVATQSFTVTAEKNLRFRIQNCEVRCGGSHGGFGWTRRVVPSSSAEARRVLASEEVQRRDSRARNAVDAWIRGRNRETRLAAIVALQAIGDDDLTEKGG